VTYEKESRQVADGPKHGKVDENNAPHVGGNTWAGGTGKDELIGNIPTSRFCLHVTFYAQ